MSAAALGGVSASQTTQSPGTNAFASMDSGDFVRVMIAELSGQDPFSPNDSAQILEQLASLRSIESQTKLEDALQSLVLQNGIAQASGMIGFPLRLLARENYDRAARIKGRAKSP